VKVLFNLLDAGIGGGQQVAVGVAGELRRRGHAVGVVVPAPGPATVRLAAIGADVHVADLLSLRRPAGIVSAARIARRYDVVYSHTSVPGEILAGIAAAAARRPHVVHQHPYPHFSSKPPARALQNVLYRTVVGRALVIAVAQHVADAVAGAGVPRNRIRVVPNGVEIPEAASPPASAPPLRIGMLARLDASKGIAVFAAAVRRARLEAEVEVVLGATAGAGPEADALLRQVADAGIRAITPEGPGVEFLRTLDVVVLPSRHEGHPLVLLEAMALGKAIIASEIPGVREVLEPDGAGLLFPPDDADALAEALRTLVDDQDLRGALGARAREVAVSRFAVAGTNARVIDVLERAVAGDQ
jgi:glycosyltransferase involved in cell wall biosynthesis